MSQKPMPNQKSMAQHWYETEFLPWKAKANAYSAEKAAQQNLLRQHVPALQTMVGLLMEGQTKRAVMAWNSLGLQPMLTEIVIGKQGDEILLRTRGGKAETMNVDAMIAGLEALVAEPAAQPAAELVATPAAPSAAPQQKA